MSQDHFYRNLGHCFHLLAHSETHKHFNAASYFDVELCPANWCGQLRVYVNEEDHPVGFVTWARVTETCKQELINHSRALYHHEWAQGEHLFFNDFVAPWGGVRYMLSDLTSNIFPSDEAFSISRNKAGKTEKVHRWIGKHYRD